MATVFTAGWHTHNKKTRKDCGRNRRLSPFPLDRFTIRDPLAAVKSSPLHIPDLAITHITTKEREHTNVGADPVE